MNKKTHQDLIKHMMALKNPSKAKLLMGFFKTGEGQYGYGDQFLGLTVPTTRSIVKEYTDLTIKDLEQLIKNPWHEIRVASLFIAVEQFKKGDKQKQHEIATFYLAHTTYINNWDLVDLSAHYIIGPWVEQQKNKKLYELARSTHLWEKRIAIVATFHFIRQGKEKDTFAIADILMNDTHDLMHKAVGWMLREVGKRVSEKTLEDYLKSRYKKMPRTALRYAIERFSPARRQAYLKGTV